MKLLTTSNIKHGQWIKDPNYGLCQIIHVHKSIAKYLEETPFTYKIYGGHLCHKSATKTGKEFKLYIIPHYIVYIMKSFSKLKQLFN